MEQIVRENLDRLMVLVDGITKAVHEGDYAKAAELEADIFKLSKQLDEATEKLLVIALQELVAERQVKFEEDQKKFKEEQKQRERELAESIAVGVELAELVALTQESIDASERGDTKRVDEILELLKARNAKLSKEFQYSEE